MKLNETKKMNEDFVCPDCKGSLRLDHNNKSLNCEHHGQFTIKNGIPSFCNSKDFDFHWDDNQLDKISQQKIDVALDFLKPVFQSISNKNKISRILDAGCGDGVHAHVLDKFDSSIKSSKYYGMDISYPGLVLAKSRIQNKTNFCFIHGDIQKLPFEDNFFDTVISFGVLAYTDDPFLSFCELNRVTKKNAMIGIWIYPKANGIKGSIFVLIRKLSNLLGKKSKNLIANLIVPFLIFLPTRSKMHLGNSSWKQCREVVLVNIAPSQLFFPEQSEIEKWFIFAGLEIIKIDKNNPITIWGRKR